MPPDAIGKRGTVRSVPTAAAGYVSDGRDCHITCGRRKARGIMNQIHAAIWKTTLRAKAVWYATSG